MAGFLGLVPGTALLRAAAGIDSAALVGALGLLAFAGVGVAMWGARARERVAARARPPGECAPATRVQRG